MFSGGMLAFTTQYCKIKENLVTRRDKSNPRGPPEGIGAPQLFFRWNVFERSTCLRESGAFQSKSGGPLTSVFNRGLYFFQWTDGQYVLCNLKHKCNLY